MLISFINHLRLENKMNNSTKKSLKLKKDSLRVIEAREAAQVHGGMIFVKKTMSSAEIATKCTC